MTEAEKFAASFGLDRVSVRERFEAATYVQRRIFRIGLDAAERSTDIAYRSTREALDNLRTASEPCRDPAGYGRALSRLTREQGRLAGRATAELGDVVRAASDELVHGDGPDRR